MARAQAQRRKQARSRSRSHAKTYSSAEDLMFFPKLRRRAKWVFLLLAIAFALGFVAFGVGTGVSGTSIGDVLHDFFSRSGGADLDSARKKAESNRRDAAAQLAYANALQTAGKTQQAIPILERYTTMKPKDTDALKQLAALWGSVGAQARQEAQRAQAEAALAAPQSLGTGTTASPFLQEVEQNKIAEAISNEASTRATNATIRSQDAYRRSAQVYQQLTLLTPDDASMFLQLGLSSQNAADYTSAIAAYKQFLVLAPDDASAPLVKQELKLLEAQQKAGSSLPGSG
jgi:tetratricopeptide (TPR) repeat protein